MAKVEFVGFDYMDEGIVAEIKRNVEALLGTPEGSCPGDRAYGVKMDFVDMPINVARNRIALEAIEKLGEYEPRAELIEADLDGEAPAGKVRCVYMIGPNRDYETEG